MNSEITWLGECSSLAICNKSPQEILLAYAGLARFKPVNYFGAKFTSICDLYRLDTDQEKATWYKNFLLAYSNYWEERPGRMSFYEAPRSKRRSKQAAALIESLLPPAISEESYNKGISLRFVIPAVELYRRATCLPISDGLLNFSAVAHEGSAIHFMQVDIAEIPESLWRQYDVANRHIDGLVWLSNHETKALQDDGINLSPLMFAFTKGNNAASIPARATVANWEELSHSVEAAHIARLAGVIDINARQPNNFGLIVAGAIRAIKAMRFKAVFDALPLDIPVRHTITGIEITLDNAYLSPVIEAAYKAKVLPVVSVQKVKMKWEREPTAFDALFERYLSGDVTDLNNWNLKALIKGGLYD